MMRPRSRDSDIDEPSEDALLEAELARMQRSYRVMQNDYKAYREETKRIVNRQKSLIEALERERLELDTQMSKMETTQNQDSDSQNSRNLAELARAEKDYLQEIKEERTNIKELKNKIDHIENNISSQRKKMGGIQNGTIKTIATHKKKAVLENRLDKAMVHFNKQLAVNRSMREDIEHLRRERAVFENLYKKLAKELENAKAEMKDIIEASTQAFEQRDEAQNKMAALRERSEKDQQQHNTEVKDLQRIIRHDDKVKEFMNIKNNDRADFISEEMAKRKKNGADDDKGINAEMEMIRIHEEAFSRIKEVTGDDDIELIVEDFIRNEEENFALFNYVNELNSEVETVQEDVAAIKKDIEQYKKEDTECDNKRDQLMKQLEKKYTQTTTETARAEERLKESNKVLDELRVGIHTMFRRLGCDPRPIREMLGGEDGVTNKNMMIYLGQIEQKTTELLNMLQFSKMKRADIMGQMSAKSEPEPAKQTGVDGLHMHIAAPSTWDELESEEEQDEEPRPLSEADLREKVMRQLLRRTQTPQRLAATASGGGQKKPDTSNSKEKKKTKKTTPQIKVGHYT